MFNHFKVVHLSPEYLIRQKRCWLSTFAPSFSRIKSNRFTNDDNSPNKDGSNDNSKPPRNEEPAKIKWFKFMVLPALATLTGFGMYQHWQKRPDDTLQAAVLHALPFRVLSRAWGWVARFELPLFLREPLYQLWARTFDANLAESKYPLQEYPSLAQFFARPIKEGIRPLGDMQLLSPVDGRVTMFGLVSPDGRLDQIKGSSYSVSEFLGFTPQLEHSSSSTSSSTPAPSSTPLASSSSSSARLYYCVLYLGPGDYHRVHSSCDWQLTHRRHFPGSLLSVNPHFLRRTPQVLSANERIALSGQWKHGFFSLTNVGAQNVGSIKLNFEPDVFTNALSHQKRHPPSEPYGSGLGGFERTFQPPLSVSRGQELARFELGSTVVLVFEAPQDFGFNVVAGHRVKQGQSLGDVSSNLPATTEQALQLRHASFPSSSAASQAVNSTLSSASSKPSSSSINSSVHQSTPKP